MSTTVKRKEYFLSLDNFNRPAEVEGGKAVAYLIARLIMLDPGAHPLHPTMGEGLIPIDILINWKISNQI